MMLKIEDYQQVWDIWAKSKDRLYAYLLAKFSSKELAENVSQEIILNIHKACCNGKEINNLNAWLFQIAHHAGIDYVKKEQRNRLTSEQYKPDDEEQKVNVWDHLSLFLEPLIDFLPPEHATALRLADLQKVPQQEIADQLGISLTATKSRIQRARKKLMEQLKTCCHLEFNNQGQLLDARIKDSCEPLKKIEK